MLNIHSINHMEGRMKQFNYITLREKPELKDVAAEWFHSKWGVPKDAYIECMDEYLSNNTENGWYLCLSGDEIVAGMGVIDNDFHNRKDLTQRYITDILDNKSCGFL